MNDKLEFFKGEPNLDLRVALCTYFKYEWFCCFMWNNHQMKNKIRVEPLIGNIEESVWNDADEQAKPNDNDLQPKHFNNVQLDNLESNSMLHI